jgi:hypothetical protein
MGAKILSFVQSVETIFGGDSEALSRAALAAQEGTEIKFATISSACRAAPQTSLGARQNRRNGLRRLHVALKTKCPRVTAVSRPFPARINGILILDTK